MRNMSVFIFATSIYCAFCLYLSGYLFRIIAKNVIYVKIMMFEHYVETFRNRFKRLKKNVI